MNCEIGRRYKTVLKISEKNVNFIIFVFPTYEVLINDKMALNELINNQFMCSHKCNSHSHDMNMICLALYFSLKTKIMIINSFVL